MKDIETNISILVKEMFPNFYKEEGEDFITFVTAYYEWLEQNHQLLTLSNTDNFNVGDTVTQDNAAGTIISKDGNDILVYISNLETFKCVSMCSSYDPIRSSSGGTSYIEKGGLTRRLGAIFLARNLPKIRNIDTTIDIFISNFKEKYLKNIEFEVQSNKKLLVKNSLDLYRSKGTERSIDLFFRLIYGVNAKVYYPGDDLFKLSSGNWVKPRYLEIFCPNQSRAIDLVGKRITGATSGASAFVEKYIIRKIKNSKIHILYVSNVSGEFLNKELIRQTTIFTDSPYIVGSLNEVEIVSGSSEFSVGDIVSFSSIKGDRGLARVTSTADTSGIAEFLLIDGGFGYTENFDSSLSPSELSERTQTLTSEKVLKLTNINVSNIVSGFTVSNGGTGYSNTDRVIVSSNFVNAYGYPVTNSSGGIISILVANHGSGFTNNTPSINITNSSGGVSVGSNANIQIIQSAPPDYFKLFERVSELRYSVEYDNATNTALFPSGSLVHIGNSSGNVAFGKIVENSQGTTSNGIFTIVLNNYNTFGVSNTIYLTSNSSITANIVSITNLAATGNVIGHSANTLIYYNNISGNTFNKSQEIYQIESGVEIGNAIIDIVGDNYLDVINMNGVFKPNTNIIVRGGSVSANVISIEKNIGLYDVANNFSYIEAPKLLSYEYGVTGEISAVSSGTGAAYKVGSLNNTEVFRLNTDKLQTFANVSLSAASYGFAKNTSANASSILLSALTFKDFELGSIYTLSGINPGSEYNISPFTLTYQPFIIGYNLYDYYLNLSNSTGSFTVGETVNQQNTNIQIFNLTVTDENLYEIGENVYQGTSGSETATGYIYSINTTANVISVVNASGTFTNSALKSYITPSINSNVISVTSSNNILSAKGIVLESNNTYAHIRRIECSNNFVAGANLIGLSSGVSASIASINHDYNNPQAGLNSSVSANVSSSNGSVVSLEIIDSGLGYSNGEIINYISNDGLRSGEAKVITTGLGIGSGYYKSSKGFLSSTSKIIDSDYYQEYSYEILSKIPLDRYAEMFKKVMHTAGTKFFGSVVIEEEINISSEVRESSITEYNV